MAADNATGAKRGAEPNLSGGVLVVTSLVAGASAGALAKTAIAPLDRTKINFQISNTPYTWRGVVIFVRNSVSREGWIALWRGNSATMARIIPYAAIQFTAHEQWKRLLAVDTPHTAQEAPFRHLIAGSLAGVTSQSATYPLDLARARMAVADYRSLKAVFVRILSEEGAVTLYRGYGATVLGVIPYAGVSFFTYDSLKHWHLDYSGTTPHGFTNVLFGGVAGALGQTSSYPLDVVRRRMQTAKRAPDGTYPYPAILPTLAHIYRTEGWRAFFKGLSMNWIKGPIAVGISFATYDQIKTTLREIALTFSSLRENL
ncbi:mitochondrial coenzyme A transporter SLC25A42 [Pieris brassicae]|uniref:mitochondrial coenzyme A transporter SLC25A42 n=1 Tax=Pieris brassicae TaxID=7116 RepID=UPI001E65FD8E|nr:mitochondrial coenzyme A transporter SLC25A42 [Pieris brassicae]XP_045526132.1 mitochondrial coenzyme A transporter SLC25A42 [Pieris brassicae]XP_045526133.1 mitochondrial coenzyme A transporter SLC25A42 [Pieris brassicae]